MTNQKQREQLERATARPWRLYRPWPDMRYVTLDPEQHPSVNARGHYAPETYELIVASVNEREAMLDLEDAVRAYRACTPDAEQECQARIVDALARLDAVRGGESDGG